MAGQPGRRHRGGRRPLLPRRPVALDAYVAGHVPGAVFVDVGRDLSSPGLATAGRHPLPSPEEFAAAMGHLGVGDEDAVVAYDDSGGGTAGRLVWMLRAIGHDAALLDGGLGAWPGAVETGPPPVRSPAAFTPRPWPAGALVEADEVAVLAAPSWAAVLDARAAERYRGDPEPVDSRAGHVPGAISAPWQGFLDPATGRFLPADVLRARFEALG